MNPHEAPPTSLKALCQSLWKNRRLINQMVKREVIGRYRGSVIGLGWSFFNPILMLTIYTFVFSVVFKARWGNAADESRSEFALVLFAGLIMHGLLADVLNRAPGLIPGNVNYVKKVVFPLEVLPVVTMGATLFHSIISLSVLLVAFLLLNGFIQWTVILIPIVMLPLVFITLGFSWMLAAIGVYLRDVGQTIGIITTIMLFLAPVFYPLAALPEKYHIFILMNPLTYVIEQARLVLVFGQLPHWGGLSIYWAISITVAWLGFWCFQKFRKGFADVL